MISCIQGDSKTDANTTPTHSPSPAWQTVIHIVYSRERKKHSLSTLKCDSIEESKSLHRFTLGACMQHTYWRSLGRRCEKSELLVEMALLALAIESPCIETLLDLLVNLDILVHCFKVVLLSRFFPSELHHFRYVYVCAELHFYEVYKI